MLIDIGVMLLLITAFFVLCYLIFLSFKLLGKAEQERKADPHLQKPKSELHPKLKNKTK